MRLVHCLLCVLLVFALCCAPCSALSYDEGNPDYFYKPEMTTESDRVSTFAISPEDFENNDIKVGAWVSFGYMEDGKQTYLHTNGQRGYYNNTDPLTVGGNQFQDVTSALKHPNHNVDYFTVVIESTDNDILLYKKNEVLDFSATNLLSAVAVYDMAEPSYGMLCARSNWYYTGIKEVQASFIDRVGNAHKVRNLEFTASQNSDLVNIATSVTVPVDAYEVRFYILLDDMYAGIEQYMEGNYEFRASWGLRESMFALTTSEADNSGFFGSILSWLQNIRDGIVNVKDGVSNLGSGITNVFNAIKNLPTQIWSYISDGLKNLFIPSENDMVDIKDDWDALLSDRFGAVYEAGTLVVDWANNFQEQSAKNTISMPSVTVDLAGTPFTFGGYEVELVPDRFDFLVDILRGVLDICCTLLFVNAMKKRYDNVVGGGGV